MITCPLPHTCVRARTRSYVSINSPVREMRETHGDTQRDRETDGERHTETVSERERDGGRERGREGERGRE